MNHSDWFYFIVFGGFFGLLFLIVEIVYSKFHLSAEFTRKLLHVIIGITSATFCYLFKGHLAVLLLALLFYAVLGFGKRFNFMKSIHDVKRHSYGGVIFPLSIWLIFFLNKVTGSPYFYFEISILILSISDAVATLGGIFVPENIGNRNLNSLVLSEYKTRLGSLFFFVSSFFVVLFKMLQIPDYTIYSKLLFVTVIPVFSTLIEAFSKKGFDNLLIPLSIWFIFILEQYMI